MSLQQYLGPVRFLFVLLGLGLFAAAIETVASLPPAHPNSDGFVEGLAYIGSLLLGIAGLLLVELGYAIPAGVGRFRGGPLADRSSGLRAGAAVLAYLGIVVLMVYGIPFVIPSVTESMAYATGLMIIASSAGIGAVLALGLFIGGMVFRVSRG